MCPHVPNVVQKNHPLVSLVVQKKYTLGACGGSKKAPLITKYQSSNVYLLPRSHQSTHCYC